MVRAYNVIAGSHESNGVRDVTVLVLVVTVDRQNRVLRARALSAKDASIVVRLIKKIEHVVSLRAREGWCFSLIVSYLHGVIVRHTIGRLESIIT
ncbi:hypothetical protein HBI23_236390 [Parastagonospora nodorum]|nr:hypothetical protein HBI47_239410 [Parastagonospora nodorum]KAH5623048.1 hypothetical protein HBI23_236390 [Parastagonospora nodorum]